MWSGVLESGCVFCKDVCLKAVFCVFVLFPFWQIPTMPPSGYMGSTLENDSYPTSEDGEEEEEDEDEEEEDLEEEEGSGGC